MRLRIATVAAAAALLASLLPAQEPKKKEWKDRAEYDLYETITKSTDAKVWLETLEKWNRQYPLSDYADVRRKMYLETYRNLDKPRESFDTAADVLRSEPDSLVALSAIVGFAYRLNPPNPTDLETTENAATHILTNLDAVYSKDNRPPQMSDTDVAKAKPELKIFAQKTLGWVYYTRKDWDKAEAEFAKVLEMDPKQAQVSYWMGVALLGEAKPEKQPVALYHFARAGAYESAGCLTPTDRQQVQKYLSGTYAKYHGSEEGLTGLLASAKMSAMPPAGFHVKSAAEIEKERIEAEEAAARANPMLALWKNIRLELTGANGQTYFDASMKDAALPGGANGVNKFKGKLVSMTPAVRPKELVLAIENPAVADVTLKLDGALSGKMDPGAEIEFEGVAKSYTREPFMVTFEAEKAKIAGWSAKTEAAAKKSGGAKKK